MEYRTREVLSQWTALRWSTMILIAMYGAAPLAIAMGITITVTRSWVENPWVAALVGLTVLDLTGGFVSGLLMIRCLGREAAAGYTTGSGVNLQYDEVDAPTGLVVRASGEPAISLKTRRARAATYRAQRVLEGTTDGEA